MTEEHGRGKVVELTSVLRHLFILTAGLLFFGVASSQDSGISPQVFSGTAVTFGGPGVRFK